MRGLGAGPARAQQLMERIPRSGKGVRVLHLRLMANSPETTIHAPQATLRSESVVRSLRPVGLGQSALGNDTGDPLSTARGIVVGALLSSVIWGVTLVWLVV
jgi:hypothetical protein